MTHDLFGKLKYRERNEEWTGYAPLPLFAAVGARPELTEADAERMLGEMNAAMEGMKELMRERYGDQADAAFAQFEQAADEMQRQVEGQADEPVDPVEAERAHRREERERKRAARLAEGKFPIGVSAEPGAEPSAAQEAAFQFLRENERAVYDAVLAGVWESYQTHYADERWRKITGMRPAATVADLAGRFAITHLDVVRESRGGFAHLVFVVDSEWQDEHGLLVVYSPDRREANWTSLDILPDLLESDDPAGQEEEYVPTPHDELCLAIRSGDEAKARELVATGADINALAPDEYPPLWVAVDQMDPDEVRSLLAFGADPHLATPDTDTTPLKHARRLYKQMGFGPARKKDQLMESILSVARAAAGPQFEEIKARLEAIIAMLEEAGK